MPADETTDPQTAGRIPADAHDIFLSYAREDQAQAEWIAGLLEERGWSVWWDARVLGGQVWTGEIARALSGAKCVVVLWSRASTQSNWVLDEAGEGLHRDVLVPARLDDAEIPLGFRQVQAIDLARTGGVRDQAIEQLVSSVAHLVGSSTIRAHSQERTRRFPSAWARPVAAIAPLAIAAVASGASATEAVIDLEVRASEVSFLSTRQQDLAGLTRVSTFEAAGLDSATIPRAGERPEQVLASDRGGLALRMAAGDASRPGTITLDSLTVSPGTRVTISGTGPDRYHASLNGPPVPLVVNVQGHVQLAVSGGTAQSIDFGPPKPMSMVPDERGAELGVVLPNRGGGLLSAPLEISGLSLVRIDQAVDTTRTEISRVSTILSGTLRVAALGQRERTLTPDERLQFGASEGEIRAIDLSDGGLLLRFHGRVRRMESCVRDSCENRMPSYLAASAARRSAWLVACSAVYFLYLAVLGRRWLRAYAPIRRRPRGD